MSLDQARVVSGGLCQLSPRRSVLWIVVAVACTALILVAWVRRHSLGAADVTRIGQGAIEAAGASENPDFYREYAWDAAERALLNQQTLDKLLIVQNLAAAAQAAERRGQLNRFEQPEQFQPVTISVTEEQVNAFIQHNAGLLGWERSYAPYIAKPAVFFRKGEVILSAEVYDLGYRVSMRFRPELQGPRQLRLEMVGMLGGRSPLPPPAASALLERLRGVIVPPMDDWQRELKIDKTGRANSAAVSTALGKLVLGALFGRPIDTAVFVQLGQNGKFVPLRLTHLTVSDESLAMTLQTMSAGERDQALSTLRQPVPEQTLGEGAH